MIKAKIRFKDGSSKELPFVPKALGELMRQLEAKENDQWDLGGFECETKNILSVKVIE